MDEEIHCITSKGEMKKGYEWMRKWWLWHSSSFIQIIKKLGEFFFHTHSLTCLNNDASALSKVH